MQIYDSVKKEKLNFKPIRDGEANIYLCGPTVYDDAHLGHAKSAVSFDMLRRTLIALGYKVKFVRNYTDIDDKILKKISESGESLESITDFYIKRYKSDMKALNVLEPDISPKATECVDEMIKYIQNLLDKDIAYKLDDGIYFDTSKDEQYLCISGKNADLETIARVDINEKKRDKKDFVLWKFDDKFYDSPFGKGRPGWHSECVAMIKKYFDGDENFNIDIHAGGVDLLFPHHENEAAQCRCAEHKALAKYWMHNGFIQINGEKMSKSLQNSFFVKDALLLYPGEALRFYLLTSHYRANFNYSELDLEASKKRLDKLYRLKKRVLGVSKTSLNLEFKKEILDALSDDLNTSKALATLDEFIRLSNEKLDVNPKDKAAKGEIVANIAFINDVFGIGLQDSFEYFQFGISDEQRERITAMIAERKEAKKERNFIKCDAIRDKLNQMGINIMDTPDGTMWEHI
ncbi:cysteine--tRNA ligase [Campylobacter sp. 9BO]|uniref:cysteine--tRNA ligase n=1 Tax=Campylobacter sp. 9BO TaxID=3424759 RepID=UPI003D326918